MVPRLVRNASTQYVNGRGGTHCLVYLFFFCEHFTKGHRFYKYFPCSYPIFPIALWDAPFYRERRGPGRCEVN